MSRARASRIALLIILPLSASIATGGAGPRSAAVAAPSPSEDREQLARRLYAEGETAFNAGRYEAALKAFEDGYAATPRPGFLLNMAHTERKLGDLRKARALYKKFLLVDPTSHLRDEVRAVISELDSALADEDLAASPSATAPKSPGTAPTISSSPAALPAATPPAPTGPVLIATQPPSSPADTAEQETPLYRRAWFWIAVGVVAAAGAGGVIYATQRTGADPYHSSGSLGAIGP